MRDLLLPLLPALAGLVALAWVASVGWRLRRDRRALDTALGLLAEFRLPLPAEVHERLPPVLRPLVQGYERVFAEMLRRDAALAERVERYAFMELHTEDMLVQVDGQGCGRYVSTSVRKLLGYDPQELVGQRLIELLHPDERDGWIDALKAAARERRPVLLEGRWRRKDGRYVLLEFSARHAFGLNGRVAGTISMARDVEARNALREQLVRAAHTDHLTGLPNRAALAATLERFRAASGERPFVLLLFDLDRFKQVNDSLGHAAGDAYLIEAASRVRAILRPGDSLARMGGDEFVGLFDGVASEAGARSIGARILEAVSRPWACQGALLHPKASVGMVVCADPALPSDELISRADRAMYAAKRSGGNLAIVWDDDSHGDSMRQDFGVEQALTRALNEQRLVLQFQPIVDAARQQPVLAEALVRLRADDGTLVGPGAFIEVAERTGQIFQLGQWVLEQACRHACRLAAAGVATPVSVNVSPRQLMHVDYVPSVEAVLDATGVEPASIVLEVTETALLEDTARARATIDHLRRLGFRLALDDFGSGHSSISLLTTLPFDILKIDRTFVRDMPIQHGGAGMLGAIVDIGRHQRLTVIAEGVETAEQARVLQRLGCDLLQGFHFFRPMDADDHVALLTDAAAALQPA